MENSNDISGVQGARQDDLSSVKGAINCDLIADASIMEARDL